MATKRFGPAAAALNNALYVFGGSTTNSDSGAVRSMEAFDLGTNGPWEAKASMSTERWVFEGSVIQGRLCAVGGRDTSQTYLSSVECYTPSTD